MYFEEKRIYRASDVDWPCDNEILKVNGLLSHQPIETACGRADDQKHAIGMVHFKGKKTFVRDKNYRI